MPNIEHVKRHLKGDTGRLAATYLAIIMALTIMFSSIIYGISSAQFNRPLPRHNDNVGFNQFDEYTRSSLQQLFQERADQARTELLLSLLFLNVAVLIGGGLLSYYLARRTLEPIEQVMEAQNRFVSDASHELRTPLTTLQVTNEVALRKKKLTLEQAKDLIGYNLAETIKLKNLSNALLGLAKQENADTTVATFDIKNAVAEAIISMQPQASERSITIVSTVRAADITANAAAVEQIMKIFIDNAIKYSPKNSQVEITSKQQDAHLTLSVSDHGPGVPPEHREKIFERFYRIDESRSSSNVEGNGLGLAIAKTIATKHGLSVSVDDSEAGARFNLVIPHKKGF